MKRITSPWLALVSACVAALAPAITTAARPHYGGTLRVQAANDAAAKPHALSMVFETLTRYDEKAGMQPVLVRPWRTGGGNGSRWEFRLRDDITLHDGSRLEAWQVAASLRAVEPGWKIATDGNTVIINPPEPRPDLPWILSRQSHAISVRSTSGALLGTGPFRLEREEGAALRLRAYDGHRDGRPFVDAVEIQFGRSLPELLADLEAGRSDLVEIDATDVRRVEQRGLSVVGSRPQTLVALQMEPHRAGDDFVRVRRTLSTAVNRETIASVLLQRRAEAATWVQPGWFAPPPHAPASMPLPLSRTAVAALPIDQRQLVIRASPTDPLARAVAERIAADAREAGFALRVQVPTGLAPRADARITRIPYTPAPMSSDAADEANSAVDRATLIPIVFVQELYGAAEHVGFWNEPAVKGSGDWNFASLWLRNVRP